MKSHTYVSATSDLVTPLPPLVRNTMATWQPHFTANLAQLINTDTVHLPVRLSKDSRVVAHIINAALTSVSTLLPKHTTRPITTERGIEDNVHVAKTLVDVAASASIKSHNWSTPVLRHWSSVPNVGRDGVAWKEPHINPTTLPLRGINASSIIIKSRPEVSRIASANGAAVVPVIGVAVTLEWDGAGGAVEVHDAAWGGVEGYGVCGLEVDAFDYVDFAGGGPVGTEHLCGVSWVVSSHD